MTTYHHLTNMRTPFDGPSQDCLMALGDQYRISLPIEADPAPGITPVPQPEMIQNGIVGLYVTLNAASNAEMRPHWPVGTANLHLRPCIMTTDDEQQADIVSHA